jgi:hypothetical protein
MGSAAHEFVNGIDIAESFGDDNQLKSKKLAPAYLFIRRAASCATWWRRILDSKLLSHFRRTVIGRIHYLILHFDPVQAASYWLDPKSDAFGLNSAHLSRLPII